MFRSFFIALAFATIATFASFQSASAQNSIHGYLLDSHAPVGTSWVATQAAPLWDNPFEQGNPLIPAVQQGAVMTATSGFRGTATGVYLHVNYNGVLGWIEEGFIRETTGGAQTPPPTTTVASGVTYNVVNVANWASLRQATSTQSVRLAQVPRGAAVVTTGQQVQSGGLTWLSVSFGGIQGWMPTKYLGQGGAPTPPPTTNAASGISYNVVNVNNWASLRQLNSTNSRRLARVPRGAAVVTTGQQVQSGGLTWLSVSYNGIHGWMPTKYLGRGGAVAPKNPVNTGSGANGAYPAGDYRIVNVNNWASLRASPNRSARRVTTVPRGHIVEYFGERSRSGGELWLRVQRGDLIGWMPVQYLALN